MELEGKRKANVLAFAVKKNDQLFCMRKSSGSILWMLILTLAASSCKKTYEFPSPQVTDYVQLQIGKYITYRLDSLEFINFGTQTAILSYLAKDVIDDTITDNLGRPSFRVIRYLSDTTGTAPWTPNETYMITPTRQALEVIENNMRFLKLELPIVDGFTWLGNTYIDTNSPYTEAGYLDGWNYSYDSVGSPFVVPYGTVSNAITIQQANDSTGSFSPTEYSAKTYSEEVYGKNIGLIYKNLLTWQYQPPNVSSPVGSFSGFGITLRMVDHN
jgi:hypothetical protein